MKRLLVVTLVVLALGTFGKAKTKNVEYSGQNGYNGYEGQGRFDVFYSSLSPYGEWVDCNYGYAWRPSRVGHSWRPYLNGRWVWTSYGWYWASNEPFGWATFHYGRWSYDDYYGWIWIPDDVWGPSWVEWRYDNDYIGWSPLPPIATFNIGIGITFSNTWVAPIHYWNFVPCRNFTSTRVIDYVQPIERSRRIFGNTRQTVNIRSENDRVVNNGVDVRFVERRGNVQINRVDVVDNNRGSGDKIIRENNRERIEVFRPHLDARTGDTPHQRDIRRPNQSRDNGRESDRTNRDLIERGVYDRQQPRIPSSENNKTPDRQIRQNKESNRGVEAPKRDAPNREYWNQQRERDRSNESKVQQPQRDRRPELNKSDKPQERSREQGRKEQRTSGRSRRP